MDYLEEQTELRLIDELRNIYCELSKIYEAQGNFKMAYQMLKESGQYAEEVTNLSNSMTYERLMNKRLILKAELYENMYKKTDSLNKIGQTLTSHLDLRKVFDTIMEEIPNIIKTECFGIALYDEDKGLLNYELFIKDNERTTVPAIPIDSKKYIDVYCVRNDAPLYIGDIEKEIGSYCTKYNKSNQVGEIQVKSGLYYPLKVNNRIIGILTAQSYRKYAYDEQDINIIKMFCTYVAIAIWNAQLFNEIEYFATHDELTGILNRRQLFNEAIEIFEQRKKTHEKFSLIMFDIDFFKKINDTYGHVVGDNVIKEVVDLAKSEMKSTDLIGRYGGEEFIIVLPYTKLQQAYQEAETIRKKIMCNQVKKLGIPEIKITASFGVYEFKKEEIDFFKGIKRVDDALYIAKQLGRNKVVCYTSSQKQCM